MKDAIKVGSEVFDNGDEKTCAEIYKFVVEAVIEIKPDAFDSEDMTNMQKSLDAVNKSQKHSDNAWVLRRAMNKILDKKEE